MRRVLPIAAPCISGLAIAVLAIACGGAPPPVAAPEEEPPEPEPYGLAVRLEDGGTDADTDTPHTRVALVRITPDGERTVLDLEREVGACYLRDATEGALLAVTCWWAGAGAQYAVRREGDAVVAYRAASDEEGGVGAPVEVGRVEIPEDVPLQLVTGDRAE